MQSARPILPGGRAARNLRPRNGAETTDALDGCRRFSVIRITTLARRRRSIRLERRICVRN